jgi:sialate O-acetylesterase
MNKIVFVLISLLLFGSVASGKITLPPVFGDHMVLQQQAKVSVWGYSTPGAKVKLISSWNKKKYQAFVDNSGIWVLEISTPVAGGPYEIVMNDGEELILHNILIGEVWVCSGQSNMEMPLRGNSSPVLNANDIILNAENPSIRLFKVGRATSLNSQLNCKGTWQECTPQTAREFSAVAYQFGEMLQKKLNVPVGLIMSAVGGTMIESWMSSNSLQAFPEVKVPKSLDTLKAPHKEPTALYNAMIAPLTKFAIRGVIWFQGESNRHEPMLYGKLFPVLVADWRKQWNIGDFPFYYVQIAPFGSTDKTRSGPLLREAQLNAMSIIPNCGMASAMDVGMEKDIHFMDKTTPARRLAYWALAQTYGIKGIGFQGPMYKSMKTDENRAIVSFDFAPYLTSYRKPLSLFEVAGEDKIFHPAKAEINANQVIVQSKEVAHPVAVRYAFKEWVVGELYNNDGLPASSFRTDNW